MQSVGQAAPVRGGGLRVFHKNVAPLHAADRDYIDDRMFRPQQYKVVTPTFTGQRIFKPKYLVAVGRRQRKLPSMAQGGMVHAPKYKGKLVVLHNGEMVIPARQVKAVQKAMRLLK